MILNLNFIPTIKRMVNNVEVDMPHVIDYSLAQYVAEQIELRVSTENPLLEYRIAQSLRAIGQVTLTQEEAEYLTTIIVNLPIDNLLKGQILDVLNPTT